MYSIFFLRGEKGKEREKKILSLILLFYSRIPRRSNQSRADISCLRKKEGKEASAIIPYGGTIDLES